MIPNLTTVHIQVGGKYPPTTVDGSEILRENHLTGMKPMVNNEIFIISTGERQIFSINRMPHV